MSLTVGELNAKLSLDDSEFNRKTDAAGRHFQGLGNRVEGIGQKLGRVAFRAATVGLVGLGAGLVAAAYAGIKYNSSIEQTTIAMGTMLGSTRKAKVLIGEVTALAAKTPFEFPELADATKRLVAYGVASGDAVPLLTRLGDVSSALQVPIGELSDIYGKMKVSGRIMMEDINQLAGRGIPIYDALAKVMGKGKDEIRGLVEEGKVNFPDIEKAFEQMTDKGSMFGGMMDKQSRSFAGLLSTVKDNATQLFGMVMMPAFKWLTKEGLPKAIELVGKFGEGFKKGGIEGGLASIMDPKTAKQIVDTLRTVKDVVFGIGGAIGKVAGVFIGLPGQIQKVIIAVGLLAVAMRALRVPIKLPVGGGAGGLLGGAGSAGAGVLTKAGAAAAGTTFGSAFGTAAGAAIMVAWPLALAKVADKLGGKTGYGIQSPGAATGLKVKAGVGRYGTVLVKADTSKADASLAALEARADKLRARIAERMEAGKLNNDKWLDKLDQTQGQIDVLRDTVHEKMYAGHLQNQPWNTSIGGSQTRLEHFKSLVAGSMASGHITTDAWMSGIDQAINRMSTFRSMVQAPMASGHASPSSGHVPVPHYRDGRYIGTWGQGGIFTSATLGVFGEKSPGEALIPLGNPRRAAQIMDKAYPRGLGGGTVTNTITVQLNAPVYGVDELHAVIHSATMAAMEEAQVAEGRSLRGMVR